MSTRSQLNYCTSAIDFLTEYAAHIQLFRPKSANVVIKVCEMLSESEKYVLPEYAALIDDEPTRPPKHELVRLPSPIVALEYACPTSRKSIPQLNGFDQTVADRRIALCWNARDIEFNEHMTHHARTSNKGSIYVLSLYSTPGSNHWIINDGVLLYQYGEDHDRRTNTAFGTLTNSVLIAAGLVKADAPRVTYSVASLLPEVFDSHVELVGLDEAYSQIFFDTRDELKAMIQFCAVLGCENTTAELIHVPGKVIRKRERKRQSPLFPCYRIHARENTSVAVSKDVPKFVYANHQVQQV